MVGERGFRKKILVGTEFGIGMGGKMCSKTVRLVSSKSQTEIDVLNYHWFVSWKKCFNV